MKEEYIVVSERIPGDFMRRVNQLLADGWKLYGYPFPNQNKYTQVLVREVNA